MEPIEIFTATVLLLAALDLVVTTCRAVTLWWQNRRGARRGADKAITAASVSTDPLLAAPSGRRSDWYVFFHCQDLVGTGPLASQPSTKPDQVAASRQKRPPGRRVSARPLI